MFHGQSGLCLDIPRGKEVSRVQLQLYSCNWTDAQRWDVPGA
ncbi:RICIN domain-containing protein [Microlunatus flavus]